MRFFIFIVTIFYSFVIFAYNPSDLEKFKSTHVCENCDLTSASLSDNYSGADLIGSNLDDAHIGSTTFSNTKFKNAQLNKLWSESSIFSKSDFTNAQMTQSDFAVADFSNCNFTGAIVTDSNFDSANFLGSNITQVQLSSARSVCDAILPDGSKGKCNNQYGDKK